MTYKGELHRAMLMLAEDPRTIFIGQSVKFGGTGMSSTFEGIPEDRLIEFPVAEQMQLGVACGLALAGYIPVCCFPRWNFLLLAADMLVNHLDKMGMKVIIRVGVGSQDPLHPGPQHVGDYSEAFREMCENTRFGEIKHSGYPVPEYRRALKCVQSTILTEYMDQYEA